MSFKRKTIRGSAGQLQAELNRLLSAGALHEVWNMGVTTDPDDIELNLELNQHPTPSQSNNMKYLVISADSSRIDAIENDLRKQNKYMSTEHRKPLHNDKQRSVAIIVRAI